MPRPQQFNVISTARLAAINKKAVAGRKAMSEFDKALMKLRQVSKRKGKAK
jgi:hypothetical protein